MRRVHWLLLPCLVLVVLAAAPAPAAADHWRYNDGYWVYWNDDDARWYYTDGRHWYFGDEGAWRVYTFDRKFGTPGRTFIREGYRPTTVRPEVPRFGIPPSPRLDRGRGRP